MADLGPQLFVAPEAGPPLCEANFVPVERRADFPWVKPKVGTGLWTSTYDAEFGSGWIQWCLSEEFYCDRDDPTWQNCWLLTPRKDARIFTIDSYTDLAKLMATHGIGGSGEFRGSDAYPDWPSVARDYDAVHLTDAGQWDTRMSHPFNLYGWDCESTLWLSWAFESVENLGSLTFKAKDPWWEEANV